MDGKDEDVTGGPKGVITNGLGEGFKEEDVRRETGFLKDVEVYLIGQGPRCEEEKVRIEGKEVIHVGGKEDGSNGG